MDTLFRNQHTIPLLAQDHRCHYYAQQYKYKVLYYIEADILLRHHNLPPFKWITLYTLLQYSANTAYCTRSLFISTEGEWQQSTWSFQGMLLAHLSY